jgi:hypothetical protein
MSRFDQIGATGSVNAKGLWRTYFNQREWLSPTDVGAVGNGIADDSDFVEECIENSGGRVLFPAFYRITRPMPVLTDTIYRGIGARRCGLIKDNFNGAALVGVDVGHVDFEDFGITGPGQFVGTGNKGIDLHVAATEININITFRRLLLWKLNDAGIYAGSCSFVTWDNLRAYQCGFAGLWIDGGDGHAMFGCSSRDVIQAFLINNPAGFGPTTVTATGCYGEQAGVAWRINGGRSIGLYGCAGEAAINRGSPHIGYALWITGGDDITTENFMCRNDTIGAEITAPYILVDGSATNVRLSAVKRIPSDDPGHTQPAIELQASAATSVILERNTGTYRFDPAKIVSGGKISVPDLSVLA